MSDGSRAAQRMDESLNRDDTDESIIVDREPKAPQLTRLGRYRLVREIASGGMASVNLAVADGVDKLVALKMIHPHLAQEDAFVEMFLDEARIASAISHRNVCNVFDFGEADGRFFIAMDYLAGTTLRDVNRRLKQQPDVLTKEQRAVFAAYILAEACEGLHAAHEVRGTDGELLHVVHRDVSPHNLFVTYDGNVSVVDFGIARASDRIQHTATGVLKGKFSYMAPEQVRQLEIDRRVDVWALGVCLWECLTLERLFVRTSQADTLMAVLMDRIRPPSELVPGIPTALDMIVLKALARNPQQRYATARELGRDLMQFVRTSTSPVGMVEVEQLVQRMFHKEVEQSRKLLQSARLASIEDAQLNDNTQGFTRTPTRSGAMLRARMSTTSSFSVTGTPVLRPSSANEVSQSVPELTSSLLSSAVPSRPSPRLRSAKTLAVALSLAGGVAVAFSFGLGRTSSSTGEQPPAKSAAIVSQPPPVAPSAPMPHAVEPKLPAALPEASQELVRGETQERAIAAALPTEAEPTRSVERRKSPVTQTKSFPSAARNALEVPTEAAAPSAAPQGTNNAAPSAVTAPAMPELPTPAEATAAAPSSTATSALRAAPVSEALPTSTRPVEKVRAVEPIGARVGIGRVEVQGSLGSGVVARMLSRAEPLLEECYVKAATRAGRNERVSLTASLTIDEMGAVRNIDSGAHPLPGLASCVADSLKRMRSERKPDVGTVRVTFEVSFRTP